MSNSDQGLEGSCGSSFNPGHYGRQMGCESSSDGFRHRPGVRISPIECLKNSILTPEVQRTPDKSFRSAVQERIDDVGDNFGTQIFVRCDGFEKLPLPICTRKPEL